MTKYILHGGNTSVQNKDNDYFYSLFTEGLTGKIKVLLCYFAREESVWKEKSKQDIENIINNNGNKKILFEIANFQEFESQLKKADVFYMRGGDTVILIDRLKKYPTFPRLVKDKVIIGSSAGAYALGKYSYDSDRNKIIEGFGLVNVKVKCHFTVDKQEGVEKLKNYKEDLEVMCIPNFMSVIILK